MELQERAVKLLKDFKGDDYRFGLHVLDQVGELAGQFGTSALVIANQRFLKPVTDRVVESLRQHHVRLAGERIVPDAGPNCPREDVYRIESYILHYRPDCLIVLGGGSSIDAAKAANVLATLGEHSPEIDSYFGTGLVSEALQRTGKKLYPLIAVETAASSGAHLTKYSNVTDPVAGQKKLIVDEAIIPTKALFDYAVTATMPLGLTIDGALDGIAHCLEVFFGASPEKFDRIQEIALLGIELVVQNAAKVIANPQDLSARQALGLATDLGGCAIMVGGTNGAHLTSFSLVDVTSHGRACGIMNPYYTVFFVAVAQGMVAFSRSINSPTKPSDLPGFSDGHIARALAAAKDPQLEMKLKNMPVALNAALVDEYMAPLLEAAKTGDFSLIKNMH